MRQYVIERSMPGVGKLPQADLNAISQKSCDLIKKLGVEIEWDHSYVTADKIYSIYRAASEELIRTHALQVGLPADNISEVAALISPLNAT